MKKCNKCGQEKAATEFYKWSRSKDGLWYCCKSCRLAGRKKWYHRNAHRERKRRRDWAAKNMSRVRDSKKKFWTNNRERLSWNHIYTIYRLREDQFKALLARQGGGCAVCKSKEPKGRGGWHIDHDHRCCPGKKSCGKCVRGLLCHGCNIGIGALGDSPANLKSAAAYLTAFAEIAPEPTGNLYGK